MDRETAKALREYRQERPSEWKANNSEIISSSGIPHTVTNNGQTIIFREPGMLKVDFYPSTGRWRIVGDTKLHKVFSGGARKFVDWYNKLKNTASGGAKEEVKP
jgi:hypothetical protein